MENVNIDKVKENSLVKFISEDKTFFDGLVKTVDKNYLGIVINVNQSSYKEFEKNEDIQLIFIYDNQLIRCGATIIGSKISADEQAIIINIPKVILKLDRREYERIDVVLDAEYSQLPEGLDFQELSLVNPFYFKRYKKTYTIDISAGGVNIVISSKEKDSKFVLLAFSISGRDITTLCSMVRSEPMDDGKCKKVAYKFVDIEKQHRQLILNFVNTKLKTR